MIGFEMSAVGTGGYRTSRSGWTEGSMVGLSAFMMVPKVNPTFSSGGGKWGTMRAIERGFGQLGRAKMEAICAQPMNVTLILKGDMDAKFYFDSKKGAEQLASEFMNALQKDQDKVGDHVLIAICDIVQKYETTAIMNRGSKLILTIDVDL
ncbi:MAG: hypothetical protein AAF744_14830 [Pseudomonadota bacterium]